MKFPLLYPENQAEQSLRLSKVRAEMRQQGVESLLIHSSVNLYYLTGGVCRGYYYLPAEGEPIFFKVAPARPEHDFEVEIRKPEQISAVLKDRGYRLPESVGLEYDDLYYGEVDRLKRVFEGSKIVNGSTPMRRARMLKTDYEIEKMREDGIKQSRVYGRIDSLYREGVTDIEMQAEIEREMRREGCLGYLRAAGSRMELSLGSLIAGGNADVASPYDFTMGGEGIDPSLPVGANGTRIEAGMTVMIDMNGGYNGYQTDMTRCRMVGEVPEIVKRGHECSRAILRDCEAFIRPGVEIGEIYRRAVAIVKEAGLEDYFMGHVNKVAFIGHGVGIELNEMPVIMERNKEAIAAGMTLAIEPKFVFAGVGAVGVENTYVVHADRLENLTCHPEEMTRLDGKTEER